MRLLFSAAVCMFFQAGIAAVENATTPGETSAPYPTITNLAVEWLIKGDDNQNGVVAVRFRKAGEEQWRDAMPLRRVPAGKSQGTNPIFTWENKHSGSIFDLRPNTEYEINLKLFDPDGGQEERNLRTRTRPVPKITDGEIVNVSPGVHDTLSPRNGQPGRPVIYTCTQGEAVYKYIDLANKKWVYVEGLTVKNTTGNGRGIRMEGAEFCVVRRCKIDAVYGIVASKPGMKNCYIADNVITGTTPWTSEAMGANGKNIGEGIEITGPGNVICYNKVTAFRDCISTWEDSEAKDQICIDIYGNDIYIGADDAIESDFCYNNCRIMRNRITNSFVGLSSQPGLGGPTYFIRNVIYNLTYAPYKLHRRSYGDVVMHNTVVKVGDGMACFSGEPFDYAYFRNNIAIGGPSPKENWGNYGAGQGRGAGISAHGSHCSFDYDAVGSTGGGGTGSIGGRSFGQVEAHGITIDMKIFNNVQFPSEPVPGYDPPDLRPLPGSKVVDAAQLIPNVNDKFIGNGPDIGAYEAGQELPHYGPRPQGVDEETEFMQKDIAKTAVAKKVEKPEEPKGPTTEEIDVAKKAVEEASQKAVAYFKERIAAEVAAGKKENVIVDFGGTPLRGEIVSADNDGILLKTRSGDIPVTWDMQPPKHFAEIASKYASAKPEDAVQLALLYHAAGEKEKAAEKLDAAANLPADLETLVKHLRLLIQSGQ